jgi:hypothetical protein
MERGTLAATVVSEHLLSKKHLTGQEEHMIGKLVIVAQDSRLALMLQRRAARVVLSVQALAARELERSEA